MVCKLILALACIGLLMGVLGLFGLTGNIEWLYWLVFGLFSAYAIGRVVPEKAFQHGLIIGCLWITATLIKVIFYNTYIAHNPAFVATYQNVSGGMGKARMFMLLTSPLVAAMMGVLLGFLSWVVSRLFAAAPKSTP